MTDELALHPAEPPVMQAQHGPEGGTPLRRAQRSAAESTGIDLHAAQRALRGVRALGATTVTSALLGMLRTDARSRAEFFSLARVPGLSRRRRWREGARDERSAD